MTPADFDFVAKHVYINLEHINRYLGKAKIASKFLSDGTNADDLPETLLSITKEDVPEPTSVAKVFDLLERPSEEEIDTLFETIRSRPSGANGSNKNQRHGSFKKATAGPLQQSRLLNETNLITNSLTSLGSSYTDLTGAVNKSTVPPPKQPTIDVEALVAKFRQTISMLDSIENGKIENIDLSQIRQQFRREWASTMKACRNVEALLDEFRQQSEKNGSVTIKKEPLISSELVKSMKQFQTKLHYAVSIKKAEVLPDMTKTLNKEVFPLSECLDTIDETIRQKQL
ncbi:uncharacterized protein LOC128709076 [Anopheles marshallii]|uniref:uncharacterized protein LOC128709076 n=1 Tax=Anopheles marshallii TaxID=1521116 RepID=UPI00237A0EF2|nr:uncharacterized protein LOC128709076 [Anopheles marshallii]